MHRFKPHKCPRLLRIKRDKPRILAERRQMLAEFEAAQAEKIANSGELAKTVLYQITSDLYTKGVVEGGFGSLETADLKGVVQTIKDILGKANEILKSRKS